MKHLLFTKLLVLLLVAPTVATASNVVEVETEVRYYNVYGSSEWDIRADLNKKGPTEAGRRFDAYTEWSTTWERQCDGEPSVSVEVIYTLPRWVPTAGVSASLESSWNRYSQKLFEHERGHGDIAVRYAQELLHSLSVLPTNESCSIQDIRARLTSLKTFLKYKIEEINYDVATNHGETQGATFP